MKLLIEAVNELLLSIGEQPIDNEVQLHKIREANIAKKVLLSTKREVLSDAWDCNTDTEYSFPQDPHGYINIPENVLSISDRQGNLIMREHRLYDKADKTTVFDKPQTVDVVWDLDFNELSHPIRNYITKKAIVSFQTDTINDQTMFQQLKDRELEAEMVARRDDGHTGRYNVFDTEDSRVFL